MRHFAALLAVACCVLGCKSTSVPAPVPPQASSKAVYPSRPAVASPTFKVFHKTDNSVTLVTDEHAADEQIEAILWQLRDAAHSHTLAKLGVDQAFVDKRDPSVWFHLYRGAKCASEKYAAKLPCDATYHGAGDFTFGTFGKPEWDSGTLRQGEKETPLWSSDVPYAK